MRPLLLLPLTLLACDVFQNESAEWEDGWADSGYYSPDGVQFTSDSLAARGTVWTETRGMAPWGSARNVWLGMGSVTCQAEFRNGAINADVDPSDGEENLTDFTDNAILGVSPNRVFQMTPNGTVVRTERVRGVVDARLWDGGLVYVVRDSGSGCAVGVDGEDGSRSEEAPDAVCDNPDAVTVDKSNGNVFVASNDGSKTFGSAGTFDHPAQGDLSANDPAREIVYVAQAAAGTLQAWTWTGDLLWTSDVGGPIQHLRANSAQGAAYVVAVVNGVRQLQKISAADGAITVLATTSSDVRDIEISESGLRFAVSADGQASFFEVVNL